MLPEKGSRSRGRRGRCRRLRKRRDAGNWCLENRLPVRCHNRSRHSLGLRAGIGGLEIDDIAQEDSSLLELVAPDDDGLEGERALAQARDHGLATRLDTLCDRDFARARKQVHGAHFAQINAHGIVGALRRLFGVRFCRDCVLNLDQLAPRLLFRLLALLLLLARVLGFEDIDAHLAEHREDILDLLGNDLLGGQYRVDLLMRHVAPLLGVANELLHRRVRQIEQTVVNRRRGILTLRPLFLLRRWLCFACHQSPGGADLRLIVKHRRSSVTAFVRKAAPWRARPSLPRVGPVRPPRSVLWHVLL